MKLKLDASPTYMLPVGIPVRLEDGSLKTVTTRFRVKRLDQDEFAELLERFATAVDPTLAARMKEAFKDGRVEELARELEEETPAQPKRPVDAMRAELREVVTGWEPTDFDPPAEFTPESFEIVLRMPAATQAIFYKLSESIPTAKQKN